MTTAIQNIIDARTSINHFQPDRPLEGWGDCIPDQPRNQGALGLQHAELAIHLPYGQAAKRRPRAAAFEQQKIMDASVAFIVCGTLAAHSQLAATLQPSVKHGIMAQ